MEFGIPQKNGKDDFMSDWLIEDNEGRLKLTFRPFIDRADNTDALIIASNQHQVFGLFTGEVTLDDGTVIHIEDELGFAEKVSNKW